MAIVVEQHAGAGILSFGSQLPIWMAWHAIGGPALFTHVQFFKDSPDVATSGKS
jgi:hypothetical protein